jgi:ribosomal protein S18 acetylase RimI-like enzyme
MAGKRPARYPAPMQLVPADVADLPFILALERKPEFQSLVGSWEPEVHQAAFADPDMRYYIVAARAGFVILRGLRSEHRSIEVKRLIIGEPGQGTGRRALEAVIRLAFGELGAHRLWLDTFVDNARARHLYTSLGFREEGVLREAYCRDGRYKSLVLLSMLDHEHATRQSQRLA